MCPDDEKLRSEQMDEWDVELESYALEQCYEVNGDRKRAKLLRMDREGVELTPELISQVMAEPEEDPAGNSPASPARTGEDTSGPSEDSPRSTAGF